MMPNQIHSYSELQQRIHEDLRIQHPDWVAPDGNRLDVRCLRVASRGTAPTRRALEHCRRGRNTVRDESCGLAKQGGRFS